MKLTSLKDLIESEKPIAEEFDPNKEFTQKDWDEHIGHVADIILNMAKSDAEGDEDEFVDNVEQYMRDAQHDIQATIAQRVRKMQ